MLYRLTQCKSEKVILFWIWRRAIGRPMGRFLALALMCLVSLSLMAGTVAHAAEPIVCLDSDVAAGLGHVDGDRDQVPSDDGKAAPHHHGGCSGHQIGGPAKEGFRSEEHTSELQSIMRNSYAVFCF